MPKSGCLKSRTITLCVISVFAAVLAIQSEAAEKVNPVPHLRKQGSATQLIVDGEPLLMLAGELGNSSASSMDYMEPIWPRLVELNLNTLLAPVYWDLIEPEEETFDFALVDGLITGARSHNLRLVLLWFGSWKNSMSCYAPVWVKTDLQRFPRAQKRNGSGMEILSAFSDTNCDADARAFAALMRHIREVDGRDHTVVMVQVENEPGMIPQARDHSARANELFSKPVPQELMDYLEKNKQTLIPEFHAVWEKAGFKTSGTWEEVFGKGSGTDEIFTAWHYAKYMNKVAAAGRAEYPLPMFANAALIRPNYKPGQYPSAGPLPHLMDVWRAAAPKIDFLAPDIYFPNFTEWCRKYHRSGNPLFIPETGRGSQRPGNAFYAIGRHDAMGFSPFSIETLEDAENELAPAYEILTQLAPLILENQGKATMTGVVPEVAFDGTVDDAMQKVELGDYVLTVNFERRTAGEDSASSSLPGGIIISTGPDDYVIAGTGLVVTFATNSPGEIAGIASIQQGQYIDGRWVPGRWLNGDQSHQGRHLRLPAGSFEIQHIKLYHYR